MFKLKKNKDGSRVFDIVNIALLVLLVIACFYPIWYVFVASFSNSGVISANAGKLLWPKGFSIQAYGKALSHPLILSGFKNIFLILLLSLPLNMVMTIVMGYFMAAKDLMYKKAIISFFMFTMFFWWWLNSLLSQYARFRFV